ncbi:AMP-binding protein [Luteolibacter sp. AS25]|uniref:AMP-binding protein n=1 Tax=Luteolibacter sp. AS25 TaxID=3135776 RepID=UPI00398AB2B8
MDAHYLASAAFWEDDGCFVAGEFGGVLPELGTCVLFRTSGSTGAGKWIVLEKKAMLHSAQAVNEWLEVGGKSVWGLALPLNHVGGFSIAARVYLAGCGLKVIEGKWEAESFAKWHQEAGITHLSLVPTQVHDLVKAGLRGAESLEAVVVGGGNLPAEMGQAARDLGWPVLASYGMTETCSQVATQKVNGLEMGFAAQPLEVLPIWDAFVGECGLLKLSGDALFSGCLVERDSNWFFAEREGRQFTTNDRVGLRGGILKPLGRADSLVKVLGELVDLEEIERAFINCSGGGVDRDCFAVVNLPNSRRENELVAVFEQISGKEQEHFTAYQGQASGIARLESWVSIEKFPRSPLGKLRRGRLREMVGELFSGGA